jgi:hypothetical protein
MSIKQPINKCIQENREKFSLQLLIHTKFILRRRPLPEGYVTYRALIQDLLNLSLIIAEVNIRYTLLRASFVVK